MVGDMSRVTYQKFLLCISSQGQDLGLYSHQKLNMYMYWFSYLRAVTDADDDDNNAGHHSTTTGHHIANN